jgi:hypothetical protein
MIVLAHIFGIPVEEFALPWVSGGAGMMMILASIHSISSLKTRRRR